jgi:hypothetical protein
MATRASGMAAKRTTNSDTRKNVPAIPTTASNPPVGACITVQNPPAPSKDAKTPSTITDAGVKNFHQDTTGPTTATAPNSQPTQAEQLMFQALSKLQDIYNASCNTKVSKITIERATFENIATTFQKAYEHIKTSPPMPKPTPTPGDASILDALQQINARITNLEAIQTIKIAPKSDAAAKTYKDVIKTHTTVTAAQLYKQQEQQRAREQKIQSTITLNTTEMNDETQKWLHAESSENIAIAIQKAVKTQLHIACAILGISKQQNTIKVHHHMNDEDAIEVEQQMNWNAIAEGLKLHEDIHGVVVHRVPKHFDLTNPRTIELFKEANHCSKPDAITHIAPLRRNPTKAEHHSIVVFSKYPEELNIWIDRGFSINYEIYRTERYIKRTQLIQCFNCYGYGHHAKSCQAKTCCGKCAEPHKTENCQSTIVKCCQCKGSHEAWHYKCPIKLLKREVLKEVRHQLPHRFVVPNRAPQEMEEEVEEEMEEEEEEPPPKPGIDTPFGRVSTSDFTRSPMFDTPTPLFDYSSRFGKSVPLFGTPPHQNNLKRDKGDCEIHRENRGIKPQRR